MQIALSARASGRSTAIAVLYDEIARREWADLSAGLGTFDVTAVAQSQNAATMLRAEREYDARGFHAGHDRAPAQSKGKAKGASRDHKSGSDHSAKGGKAKGHGKEHKGKPGTDHHRWQGHHSSGGAASGAQALVTPNKRQKREW